MKKIIQVAAACVLVFASCKKGDLSRSVAPSNANEQSIERSPNGSASIELVYYDSMLVKMNLKEFKEGPAESLLDHNKSINILYEADGYVTVTDAIQGEGYNPIWQEVDIHFNTGFAPHQFYRDDDIIEAASGPNPEIRLEFTDEIYRCDIIQHKKVQ